MVPSEKKARAWVLAWAPACPLSTAMEWKDLKRENNLVNMTGAEWYKERVSWCPDDDVLWNAEHEVKTDA